MSSASICAAGKRYPLVLMLEPLFRCNLACAGCGKIDYPDKILDQRLSVADCMRAIDECGAPVVVLAGGEPLLHRELPEIVTGALAKGKYVTVCTNALLMEKKLDQYRAASSLQLVGASRWRQGDARPLGVPGGSLRQRRRGARKLPRRKASGSTSIARLFNDAEPERVADFFDSVRGARGRRHHDVAGLRL